MNDVIYIFDKNDIQICFLLADLLAKLGILLIVYDHENQIFYIKENVDLQSVSLLTNIKKSINEFENNQNITNKCGSLIEQLNYSFKNLVPNDTSTLKIELLKKILPLELEDNYLTNSKEYKSFDFVCVLFTDIVSYTELAKSYDTDVIYKLLNEVYTLFDSIILRYPILQKIETIGDAYMVVSDIYTGDTSNNVRDVVLFALEILKSVKQIKTPNNKPLQLRIGINLGKVVVGILGVEIPRLCVIGNTVNVTSRLQSTTEPDTIQISTHVHEKILDINLGIELNYEKHEHVFLKNLGSRTTYVLSIK
jgi:atrial natriuretic peptide receptor A